MEENTTCAMCSHMHKEDGTCECGCTGEAKGAACTMCNHEHKEADGSCECGCGKM